MTVAIRKVHHDVAGAVAAVMEAADDRRFIPRSSTVFLKVNLGWDLFIPGSVTNPAVFEGVVKRLKGHAGRICVVESGQVLEDVEKAYRKSRISEIAERNDVPWINLSRCKKIIRTVPQNCAIKSVPIPDIFGEGILVTLPVMKTHNKTTVSLSLKNQWGCLPKLRHKYHRVLTEAIADVNAALGVKFGVMDGTIALEGNGPKTGRPREVGIVGAGADLVELDSVFASLMGFNPREISHLVEAERRGLGKIGSRFVGDDLDPSEPFKPAGHNLVSRIEMLLRESPISPLVFETPLLWGMLAGAKTYYYLFDLLRGRAMREKFRLHPVYGRYLEQSRP